MRLEDYIKCVLATTPPSVEINFELNLDEFTRVACGETGNKIRFTVIKTIEKK